MIVDLRSDTVTKPTLAMKAAMFEAEVGDDVFDEDPAVHLLQDKIAQVFGKEAALFCPSGTMTNQIAIRILTQPQDEVICDKRSHIYLYEGAGIAYNSLVSVHLLDGDRGRVTAAMVRDAINPPAEYYAKSSLVSLENTMNKGGGSCYELEEIAKIKAVADENGLKMHLDGARIFNALVAKGQQPRDFGMLFDTISVCFSKGLGAPVGSALLGSKELITKARRIRKVLGGGMRQAGYLAAACSYALDKHVARLADDHQRAAYLGSSLAKMQAVAEVLPVETNIVIARLNAGTSPAHFIEKLKQFGILAVVFGKDEIRFVTHLDFDDNMLEYTEKILLTQMN